MNSISSALEEKRPTLVGEGQIADRSVPQAWSVITSLTSGGAESLVVGLNSAFAARGVDHTVIALCDAATLGNSPETEERLANRISNEGGRFVSLGLGRWRDPFSGARALNVLLTSGAPDIIHAHTARAVPSIKFSRFAGPVVLTHHNSELSFPAPFFRFLDRSVDRYVAISRETEEIYNRMAHRPITRISNGVSDRFMALRARERVSDFPRIIAVGATSSQKNYDLLIETAADLSRRIPQVMFEVAGGGDGLPDFRARVEAEGLSQIVRFLGERSDVRELLSEADIFLNTSLYEGQSVAILEAMAMALPVVATDVPGNRDLVVDGENGLRAPLGDPRALSQALQRLIEEPAFYAELSANARKTGLGFSTTRSSDAHLDLYRQFCAKG